MGNIMESEELYSQLQLATQDYDWAYYHKHTNIDEYEAYLQKRIVEAQNIVYNTQKTLFLLRKCREFDEK